MGLTAVQTYFAADFSAHQRHLEKWQRLAPKTLLPAQLGLAQDMVTFCGNPVPNTLSSVATETQKLVEASLLLLAAMSVDNTHPSPLPALTLAQKARLKRIFSGFGQSLDSSHRARWQSLFGGNSASGIPLASVLNSTTKPLTAGQLAHQLEKALGQQDGFGLLVSALLLQWGVETGAFGVETADRLPEVFRGLKPSLYPLANRPAATPAVAPAKAPLTLSSATVLKRLIDRLDDYEYLATQKATDWDTDRLKLMLSVLAGTPKGDALLEELTQDKPRLKAQLRLYAGFVDGAFKPKKPLQQLSPKEKTQWLEREYQHAADSQNSYRLLATLALLHTAQQQGVLPRRSLNPGEFFDDTP